MKKKLFLLLPILGMLFACTPEETTKPAVPGREYGDEGHYALYMYNYPRMDTTASSGYEEKAENLLYIKQPITLGQKLTAPENPERTNWKFDAWYKEKDCVNAWDFENDIAESSVMLYAHWEKEGETEYVEPTYVYPETIITDANYRVTGILNEPVKDNTVALTNGGINRLTANSSNVGFAVNYERKEGVSLTVATYDTESKNIHLEVSSGETFDITVTNKSEDLVCDNTTYENKAANYEAKGKTIENYHIMFAGSSSMENWDTSYVDMLPIITSNHGIGGTTVDQWTNMFFERLVMPYSPKAVVYYVGVNDIINSGRSGKTTGQNLELLFNKTHEYLPHTQIFYVLINKLPGFPTYQAKFDEANEAAEKYSSEHDYLTCIDAGKGLLKESGQPHAGYFKTDGLHMSRYGYVIWGAAIKNAIIEWLDK